MRTATSLAIRVSLSLAAAALLLTAATAQQQTARNQPAQQQVQPPNDEFPMPARDRYFRIQDELGGLVNDEIEKVYPEKTW